MTSLATFPEEILLDVFVCLNSRELIQIALTCKAFSRIAQPIFFKTVAFEHDVYSKRTGRYRRWPCFFVFSLLHSYVCMCVQEIASH